jgi:hypothetical protein
MRAIFNGKVGRFLIVTVCIGTHLLFAIGMFYLGRLLGSLVLGDFRYGAEIFGVILATVMFIAAMIVFVYHEYTREDLEAYERKSLATHFLPALSESQKIVCCMEISSLAYRCYMTWFVSPVGAVITFVLGILMLRFAYNLGLIIHAQTNRPAALEVGRMREEAGRKIGEEGRKQMKKLPLDKLRRLWRGDPSALQEPLDEASASRREHAARQKQLAERAQREFDENEKFNDDFLSYDPSSSNGHSKQPTSFN